MNILILEDDTDRHTAFKQRLIGTNIVIVETAEECIQLLDTDLWDMLCLDHDLGGQVFVPSGPGTGYEVACWLEEHPDVMPTEVILHSLNPAGRQKMKQALPNAREVPFCWELMEYNSDMDAINIAGQIHAIGQDKAL